jgi:hypothetical protein
MKKEMYCPKHPMTVLICPSCQGKKGGAKTAKVYADKMSVWGKRGGRPKKSVKTK